jgi:predicted transposase YbfD/YdcC
VFTVKENQGRLYEDLKALLETALNSDFAGLDHDFFQTEEQGHGRQERRTYLGIYNPPELQTASEWKGLCSVVIVTRERQVGDKETVEQHYDISSCKKLRGQAWAEVIRGHWSIENNLHWVLDVIFKEDECRTQDVNAACNLALLRKIAVSLLKRMPEKYTTGNKRMYAAWDQDYLEQVLTLLSVKEEKDQQATPQESSPSLHDASIS